MSTELEKGTNRLTRNFLIVSGKNLIKPQERRSNSHSSLSNLDKSNKLEPKDCEYLQSIDTTLKTLTFGESVQKYSVLNKIFETIKFIVPKTLASKPPTQKPKATEI